MRFTPGVVSGNFSRRLKVQPCSRRWMVCWYKGLKVEFFVLWYMVCSHYPCISSLLTPWYPRHGIWKCFSCSCVLPCIPLVNMWEVTRITMIHVPTCISYAGWIVHIGETIKRADTLPEANPRLHHSPPLDHQTTQQPGQRLLSPPMEGLHLRARLVFDAVLPKEGILVPLSFVW